MMYTRLRLSKDLLTADGAIFVSIDDNEQTNIKKLCEEVFGESNKVAEFVVIRAEGGGMAKQVIKGHDYLFVYAKDITKFSPLGKPKDIRGRVIEKMEKNIGFKKIGYEKNLVSMETAIMRKFSSSRVKKNSMK